MTRSILILALSVLVGGVRLSGHHAFAAYYSEEQSVSIEGNLVEIDFRNPHVFVFLSAADTQGKMQKVSAEWANPVRLSREGVTKDTLKPGDRVIVTGSPSRDLDEFKMHLKGIQRIADGWQWGASGEVR
jgi:hypothetical protein